MHVGVLTQGATQRKPPLTVTICVGRTCGLSGRLQRGPKGQQAPGRPGNDREPGARGVATRAGCELTGSGCFGVCAPTGLEADTWAANRKCQEAAFSVRFRDAGEAFGVPRGDAPAGAAPRERSGIPHPILSPASPCGPDGTFPSRVAQMGRWLPARRSGRWRRTFCHCQHAQGRPCGQRRDGFVRPVLGSPWRVLPRAVDQSQPRGRDSCTRRCRGRKRHRP